MRRALRLLPVVVCAAVLSTCSIARESDRPFRPPLAAQQEATQNLGRTTYLRDCAWCHGNQAEGTERGPSLLVGTQGPALTHFELSTGRMPLDFPSQEVVRRPSTYSSSETLAIVDYLDSLGQPGPEIPAPNPSASDVSAGAELYYENCAACHSTTGVGGAMTPERVQGTVSSDESGLVAPGLEESTPTQVAEAMATGPGNMPVFGPGTFTDEDVDSIVAYVEYLQDPSDRGGAPIGLIGPVAEGAVAWIAGLGVLLLLVRWIGTRMGED
jgi:ubiquinol-cytochrome c reductase cytochrome c subunit